MVVVEWWLLEVVLVVVEWCRSCGGVVGWCGSCGTGGVIVVAWWCDICEGVLKVVLGWCFGCDGGDGDGADSCETMLCNIISFLLKKERRIIKIMKKLIFLNIKMKLINEKSIYFATIITIVHKAPEQEPA